MTTQCVLVFVMPPQAAEPLELSYGTALYDVILTEWQPGENGLHFYKATGNLMALGYLMGTLEANGIAFTLESGARPGDDDKEIRAALTAHWS